MKRTLSCIGVVLTVGLCLAERALVFLNRIARPVAPGVKAIPTVSGTF